MMAGQSGAALALTALAVFAFRAGGLVLAGRLGPRSPVLAWANAVSYSMLAVYVVQTLISPGSSLQATPAAARVAAALLAIAGFTALGRGLFQWLVIGAAAFSLGLGQVRTPEADRTSAKPEASPSAHPSPGAEWLPHALLATCPAPAPLFALLHHPAAFRPPSGTVGCGHPGRERPGLEHDLLPATWGLSGSPSRPQSAGLRPVTTRSAPLPVLFMPTGARALIWGMTRRACETLEGPSLPRRSLGLQAVHR